MADYTVRAYITGDAAGAVRAFEEARLAADATSHSFDNTNSHASMVGTMFDRLGLRIAGLSTHFRNAEGDTNTFGRMLDNLGIHLANIGGDSGGAAGGIDSVGSAAANASSGGSSLLGYLAPLAPALLPIGAAASAAAVGLGAFGLAAYPLIKSAMTISTAQMKYANAVHDFGAKSTQAVAAQRALTLAMSTAAPAATTAATAITAFKTAWQSWSASFAPTVLGVLNAGLADASSLMKTLSPMVHAAAGALKTLFTDFGKEMKTAGIQKFFKDFASQVGPSILAFGRMTEPVIRGLMSAFVAMGPIAKTVTPVLMDVAKTVGNLLPPLAKFGENLLRALQPVLGLLPTFATALGKILTAVTPLLAPLGELIAAIASGLLPVLEPLAPVIRVVATAIGQVLTFIRPVIPVLAALTAGWLLFEGAMALITMDPIIVGLAALVIGLVELADHWSAVWNGIKRIAEDAWHFIDHIFHDGIIGDILSVAFPLIGLLTHWKEVWGTIKSVTSDVWHFIYGDVISPIVSFFTGTIPGALHTVFSVWTSVWNGVKGVANAVWNFLWGNILSPIWVFIKTTITGALHAFYSVWTTIWSGIKAVVQGVWDVLGPIFSGIRSFISWFTTHGSSALAGAQHRVAAAQSASGRSSQGVVSRYAMGGIAGLHGPEFAIVGEQGPELILPYSLLSEMGAISNPAAITHVSTGGGAAGYGDVHITVNIAGTMDLTNPQAVAAIANQLADKMHSALLEKKRSYGGTFRTNVGLGLS